MFDARFPSYPYPPFYRGARHCLPMVPVIVTFACVAGITSRNAGFTLLETLAFSMATFSGAGQIVAADLYARGAPPVLIIVGALVVNARLLLYSAAIRDVFHGADRRTRWIGAYLLTDQAFALTKAQQGQETNPRTYYFGAAWTAWMAWQLGLPVGYLAGQALPPEWPLEFSVPLTFVSLLVPFLRGVVAWVSAGTAGLSVLLLSSLPYGLNLFAATLLGLLSGGLLIHSLEKTRP